MKTTKLTGYFDAKMYNAKKPREQWALKNDGETISFSVAFGADNLPESLSRYAKAFTDKNGHNRMRVIFKIGKNVRFFDENANAIARPSNAELDSRKYDVIIDYAELNGDIELKEPRGYWANAIMIHKHEENPFAGQSFSNQYSAFVESESESETKNTESLPF